MKNLIKAALLLSLTTSLSGCIAAVGAAGVTGVETATEDRTVGSKVDDNGIALAIDKKFIAKDKDLFGGVSTRVSEGRVMLGGKVKDPTTRKDAEDLAWQVEGVREVINEIKVSNEENFGNYISDAWITNQIRTRLLFTDGIKSQNYSVQTVDRVVYLMGIAQNNKELQAAIEVSRRTKNVQRVVSHVILKDDPRRGFWAEQAKAKAAQQNSKNNGDSANSNGSNETDDHNDDILVHNNSNH